ncbi:Mitochondrial inner membrane protease atp23 [Triticum urartu]|uniref:Mitochondrial inner membrane protease ATP23 n=1 Tax=Triticum urartu TaxID=4572 RepID=M8AKW7_TRIUA|nr:Mitochondrial inner membrane protease atp23 [Triticum urartu]
MRRQDEINQVIIHELVHAYDDCVVKNIDWKNCAHQACSEIRANHLSGNCHYKRELMKGFLKIKGHEPECVKRRALLSVKNNPHCSEKAAEAAVEKPFGNAFRTTGMLTMWRRLACVPCVGMRGRVVVRHGCAGRRCVGSLGVQAAWNWCLDAWATPWVAQTW